MVVERGEVRKQERSCAIIIILTILINFILVLLNAPYDVSALPLI